MKTLSINISENDFKSYGFGEEPVSFKEIEKKIRSAFIKGISFESLTIIFCNLSLEILELKNI